MTLISPELITAILTVLFYHHNKKIDKFNKEITPVRHPPLKVVYNHHEGQPIPVHYMLKINRLLPETNSFPIGPYADVIFEKLCTMLRHQYRIVLALKERCTNKTVTIYDMVPFDSAEIKSSIR